MINNGITDVVDLPAGAVFIPVNADGRHSENPTGFLVTKPHGQLLEAIASYSTTSYGAARAAHGPGDWVILTNLTDMRSYVHFRASGFRNFKIVETSLTLTT